MRSASGKNWSSGAWRSRWAAVGAAVAVTLGGGGLFVASAAPSVASSVVAITPTRILDTRTDVGLSGPFVPGVSQTLQVTGSVPTQPPPPAAAANQVVVPATATSVNMNVTVVGPQTGGFLSIRPGDASGTPATSNINFGAGGPNIANSVSVQLPAIGNIDIYVSGTVAQVLIDVVGYTDPATSGGGSTGPAGPAGADGDAGPAGADGDAGPAGADGDAGLRGLSAWDQIPSGQTVTGRVVWDTELVRDNGIDVIYAAFPAKAPASLSDSDEVNFGPDASTVTVDDDAACTGDQFAPTAPPGMVCIYFSSSSQVDDAMGLVDSIDSRSGFFIAVRANGTSGDMFLFASWAYTAP